MQQTQLVVRTLLALGIAVLFAACSNSGYSGAITPSGVAPDSQTRLTRSVAGPDVVVEFAYVTNYGSGNVAAYEIEAGGALRPVVGSPFSAGTNPISVATCHAKAGTCKPPPL
jgi:hypothetical protein